MEGQVKKRRRQDKALALAMLRPHRTASSNYITKNAAQRRQPQLPAARRVAGTVSRCSAFPAPALSSLRAHEPTTPLRRGPRPAIAKKRARRLEGRLDLPALADPAHRVTNSFVETTTVEKAARVHRNRQLAAKSLRNIKSTLAQLEQENGDLAAKEAELSATLVRLVQALRR